MSEVQHKVLLLTKESSGEIEYRLFILVYH